MSGGYTALRRSPRRGDPRDILRGLERVVASMPRAEILTATDDYLHAVCRTRLGFWDDLEFHFFQSEGVVHVRSASRIGVFDFGVNRRRVERVRRGIVAQGGCDVGTES